MSDAAAAALAKAAIDLVHARSELAVERARRAMLQEVADEAEVLLDQASALLRTHALLIANQQALIRLYAQRLGLGPDAGPGPSLTIPRDDMGTPI